MSLFPAYSEKIDHNSQKCKSDDEDKPWLKNSSFISLSDQSDHTRSTENPKTNDKVLFNSSDSDDEQEHAYSAKKSRTDHKKLKSFVETSSRSHHKKKKKKTNKEKKKKENKYRERTYYNSFFKEPSSSEITEIEGLFYTDKRRELGNLKVDTLYRPAVPKYDRPNRKLLCKRNYRDQENSKKFRYHSFDFENDNLDLQNIDEVSESGKEISIDCNRQITEKTREFSEKLEMEPNNIKLWLEYVKFQDKICKYEKSFSLSKSGSEKVYAEKKISILEKAISLNPSSEELLKEKFIIAEIVYSTEKLLAEATELLKKTDCNLVVCRGILRCSLFNSATCTVPRVLNVFSSSLEHLHQKRMRYFSNDEMRRISQLILVLLFECGLFMRQAGLWEQLIMLFKQYLEMNVSTCYDVYNQYYKFDVGLNEQLIYNEEEKYLNSNLPLSAIWLRIERLREGCYWLPISDSNADDDENINPQRIVFVDDIKHLIQPITPSSLNLQIVVITLHLLKLPFLPSSQLVCEFFNLNEIPYYYDAAENLLAVLFPRGLLPTNQDNHFLKDVTDLVSGPQYLIDKLGKTEFLNLITDIFELAGKILSNEEAVALYSWYFRFNRFLVSLSLINSCVSYNDVYKKKVKRFAKEKLKEPQFRNDLQLYNEFALLERDFGNSDACLNVLNTAINFRRFTYEKATYVSLYRNIVETMLRCNPNENRTKAVNVLCGLVVCNNVDIAFEKFKSISIEATGSVLQSVEVNEETQLIDLMTPDWFVEWTACHSYFLMLTKSIWTASAMVQEAIDSLLPKCLPNSKAKHICEGLYEILVSIVNFYCCETYTSYHVLIDIIKSAFKLYPNNLFFLNTISVLETSAGTSGSPWWKLSSYFTASDSVLPRLYLVFILRHRISKSLKEGRWSDTSGHNLMSSLLNSLINDNISKKCPLIWRLYLQFLTISKEGSDIKKAFYRAVEECSWVKAIYVDSIQILPESIQEIQDLLIEKELRLHSLMEELDILRKGTV